MKEGNAKKLNKKEQIFNKKILSKKKNVKKNHKDKFIKKTTTKIQNKFQQKNLYI